jgi:hypothetical protein
MTDVIDRTATGLPVIRPLPSSAPRARAGQQVTGDHWRITVLDAGLFRI